MRKSRRTLSPDLRKRIVDCYDEGQWTQPEAADRYRVSLGRVKKLLAQRQRKHTGDLAPRQGRSGRKALLTSAHRRRIGQAVKDQPDVTLEELRERLQLPCTIQAIHYVLRDLKLTFKKNAARPRARARRRPGAA